MFIIFRLGMRVVRMSKKVERRSGHSEATYLVFGVISLVHAFRPQRNRLFGRNRHYSEILEPQHG